MLDEADERVAEAEKVLARAKVERTEVRDMVAARGRKVKPHDMSDSGEIDLEEKHEE